MTEGFLCPAKCLLPFVCLIVFSVLTHVSELIICLVSSAGILIWITINVVASILSSRDRQRRIHLSPERVRGYPGTTLTTIPYYQDYGTGATITQPQPFAREGLVAPFVAGTINDAIMDQRELGVFPFTRSERIARVAMRGLPPVRSFKLLEEETTSADGCPICKEEYKYGELIQPFGLCLHEFHSSCLNSWLHSGRSTCPVCRKDLATTLHAAGVL